MSEKTSSVVGEFVTLMKYPHAFKPTITIVRENDNFTFVNASAYKRGARYAIECPYFGRKYFAEKAYATMAAHYLENGHFGEYHNLCERKAIDPLPKVGE